MRDRAVRALRELYQGNPVLAITGWIHWALAAILILLWGFDSTTILGIDRWIKPLKFSTSIAIYVWTLAWFLRYLPGRRRAVGIIAWGVAITMLIEITLITLQSARGVASHFNVATPLDATLFAIMGTTIGINTVLVFWTLVLFLTTVPGIPRAYLWGIRFGLVVFILASLEGAYMVVNGGHTVGAADGGPGLPFVNWSRQHGDLRVVHFAGMHALQILPLLGFWFSRSREQESVQIRYTTIGFAVYLSVTAVLFWLAREGRPLVGM